MSNIYLAIILGALVLLAAGWLWQRSRREAAPPPEDRIDTVFGWPPTATRVLSSPERVALATLARALPEYLILPQVPLSRFLTVPKRNSYADWLRRVGYQSVDFVICDMAAQVVAVIELQGRAPTERARKRLARIARTLEAAQIPLSVWREDAPPTVEAARDAVLKRLPSTLSGPPPAQTANAAANAAASAATTAGSAAAIGAIGAIGAVGVAAVAGVPAAPVAVQTNPFDEFERDSSLDERIELLEPPPTTWYDDMDSDTVPLGKK